MKFRNVEETIPSTDTHRNASQTVRMNITDLRPGDIVQVHFCVTREMRKVVHRLHRVTRIFRFDDPVLDDLPPDLESI